MPPHPPPIRIFPPRQLHRLTSQPLHPQRPTSSTTPTDHSTRSFRKIRSRLPPLVPYYRLLHPAGPESRNSRNQPLSGCRVIPLNRSIATTAARCSDSTAVDVDARDSTVPQQRQQQRQPALLSMERYHTLADSYIDNLVMHLEELQEEREDVDVEYSAGVLTLSFPPAGTYVLNKQPPNRQIWLSSPVSGPKRFDYVESGGSGVDGGAGEGEGAGGEWVYLRDGASLTGILEAELGVGLGGEGGG